MAVLGLLPFDRETSLPLSTAIRAFSMSAGPKESICEILSVSSEFIAVSPSLMIEKSPFLSMTPPGR
jgi:hypothetical protein